MPARHNDLPLNEKSLNAIVDAIRAERPAGAKGAFIRSLTVSSTMGVGVRVLVKDAE